MRTFIPLHVYDEGLVMVMTRTLLYAHGNAYARDSATVFANAVAHAHAYDYVQANA